MRNVNILEELKKFYSNFTILAWLMIISGVGLIIVRASFFFIVFDLYILFFSGRLFKQYINDNKLISTYLLGTLAGLVLIVLMQQNSQFLDIKNIVMASITSGILSLIVAFAAYKPNLLLNLYLIGPVKMKYIAIGFVVLDLLSINPDAPGSHLAHLGGVVYGFLSIYLFSNTVHHSKTKSSFFDWFKKKPKPNMHSTGFNNARKMTDEDYNQQKAATQEEIDKILDKIAQNGYESLSKQEKEKLFKFSNRK